MKVVPTQGPASAAQADAVVVGHHKDAELSGAAVDINDATGGVLERLIESQERYVLLMTGGDLMKAVMRSLWMALSLLVMMRPGG